MRIDTLAGGCALLGALWFGVHAALWGAANTLDSVALALHRAASAWRALQDAKSRALEEDWAETLGRAGGALAPRDEAFLRRSGIRTDDPRARPLDYTGE